MKNDDATLEWVRGRLRDCRLAVFELRSKESDQARSDALGELIAAIATAEGETRGVLVAHPAPVRDGLPGPESLGIVAHIAVPWDARAELAAHTALDGALGIPHPDDRIPYALTPLAKARGILDDVRAAAGAK